MAVHRPPAMIKAMDEGSGTAVAERLISSRRTCEVVEVFVNLRDRELETGRFVGMIEISRQSAVPDPVGCAGTVGLRLKNVVPLVL